MLMITARIYGQDSGKTYKNTAINPAAVKAINEMGSDLDKLNESHKNLIKAVSELDSLYAILAKKTQEVSRLAADAKKFPSSKMNDLFRAIDQMQEMSQSFNMQYLGLQQQMQDENRRFSLISNIMKNKHDTAKNSINNIR
jgi:uncharacterized coiled-coil DUF342 family protein